MIEEQPIEEIPLESLLERVQLLRASGHRLVQICCTRLAADHEVSYSFDLEHRLHSLRVRLPLSNPELPSISSFYWSAFLYENEIHDLFGVRVRGMAVDFHGRFYTTAQPAPYAQKEPDGAQ
jgi:ech hydrogenase subunit D